MQLPLVSFWVIFLREATLSQCRVVGQTWGGAFKPTGLNTIIRNQCITSSKGGGFFHQKGTEEGRATSKLVGEVAGPVTSRAVLKLLLKVYICKYICICAFVFAFALLLQAAGHSKVLTCSQRQLNKMEAALASCVRKVRCLDISSY